MIRILRVTSTPLTEQLRLLPSTFHTAVVHVTFPTIDAEQSVYVDASDLECAPFAEALWPALTHTRSFRMYNRSSRRANMPSDAAAALGSSWSSSPTSSSLTSARPKWVPRVSNHWGPTWPS